MSNSQADKPYRTSPGNKPDLPRGDDITTEASQHPATMQTGESIPYDVSERHVTPAPAPSKARDPAEKAQ